MAHFERVLGRDQDQSSVLKSCFALAVLLASSHMKKTKKLTKKQKAQILATLERMIKYPGMFTGISSTEPQFTGISLVFTGYLIRTIEELKVDIFIPCGQWAADKLGFKQKNFGLEYYISKRYKSDKTRLEKLYELFAEFLETI